MLLNFPKIPKKSIKTNIIFIKSLFLFLLVLFITTSNGFAGPKKRGNDTEETTTFSSPHYRVYLLQDDLESFSSALKDNEYEEVSCLINKVYRWYRLDKTETTPGFWPLVSEGTGRDLTAENTFNKGEHWIYYMPTPRAKFAVCFGQGDFLKTRGESRLIDDRYGITDFGRKVVIKFLPRRISSLRWKCNMVCFTFIIYVL